MTATAVTQGTHFDFGIEELDELVEPGFGEWISGVLIGAGVGLIIVGVAT
jgi:hypothetical protein